MVDRLILHKNIARLEMVLLKEFQYAKSLYRNRFYPRFHLTIETADEIVIAEIHVDDVRHHATTNSTYLGMRDKFIRELQK